MRVAASGTDERAPRGMQLWLMLWRATKRLEEQARRSVASTGLCLSDFGVLLVLREQGPLPVNALGREVLITSGSITAAVDRLEAQELVERRSDPTDRRARIVHLTAQGRALSRRLLVAHARDLEQAFASLTATERHTLAALLGKLAAPAPAVGSD
ncbi:MAG: MarR family transcriptional regulator [Armatimonadetes bacterium]|nr:MarR family transcriptional regulator [Armatimonadota bacterium]